MTDEAFADRLRFLRNERNISAREMSIALGQNESYINKIENCQRSVPMSSFFKICDYLHVTPADFFNAHIQNTTHTADELTALFHQLPQAQAAHIYAIVRALVFGSESPAVAL